MVSGREIVYFGDVWSGLMRNRHHLLRIFARCNRVLFVERRPHLRPVLAGVLRGKLKLADLLRPALQAVMPNLWVFRFPLWAPVSGRLPLRLLTRCAQQQAFQKALRQLHFTRPLVWFYHPEWADWVEAVSAAALRLYHVVDDYASYQGQSESDRDYIRACEQRLVQGVDAVFVVSPALLTAKEALHPRVFLVPNGVDTQAFAEALRDPRLPDELARIPPPRVGYSGLIGDKLALGAIWQLAIMHPEWSVVFLGSVNASEKLPLWKSLLTLKNVHYLGAWPGEAVPHFLKGMAVGLMPYEQDQHSNSISPLKLYDYLAAGLPIAAVDIPAVREFSAWVSIADRPEAFPAAVERALAGDSPQSRQARLAVASQHSWTKRVETLSRIIDSLSGAPSTEVRAEQAL